MEIGRTILINSRLLKYFKAQAINTTYYVTKRYLIKSIINETPYELLFNQKPKISHLRVYGKGELRKFDVNSIEGVFDGYSSSRKAYKIFNKKTLCITKSVHVIFYYFRKIEDLNKR